MTSISNVPHGASTNKVVSSTPLPLPDTSTNSSNNNNSSSSRSPRRKQFAIWTTVSLLILVGFILHQDSILIQLPGDEIKYHYNNKGTLRLESTERPNKTTTNRVSFVDQVDDYFNSLSEPSSETRWIKEYIL